MALNATMRVADIEALAGSIDTQKTNLTNTLTQLNSACQRADQFSGNAANQYDQFLAKWRTSQETMVQAMQDAADLLKRYSQWLNETDERIGQGFNVQ